MSYEMHWLTLVLMYLVAFRIALGFFCAHMGMDKSYPVEWMFGLLIAGAVALFAPLVIAARVIYGVGRQAAPRIGPRWRRAVVRVAVARMPGDHEREQRDRAREQERRLREQEQHIRDLEAELEIGVRS